MELKTLTANKRYADYLLEQKRDAIKLLKTIETHLVQTRLVIQQLERERK